MISRGTWEINSPISSITKIAKKISVSTATVRNVLKQFERNGTIECWGRLGFYLVSDMTAKGKTRDQKFIRLIQTNLKAFEILRAKGIKKRNWIVRFNRDNNIITGLNEVSGLSIETNLSEIAELQTNLLSLSKILAMENSSEFKEAKKKFDRQREIIPLARVVLNNKKELGINE